MLYTRILFIAVVIPVGIVTPAILFIIIITQCNKLTVYLQLNLKFKTVTRYVLYFYTENVMRNEHITLIVNFSYLEYHY